MLLLGDFNCALSDFPCGAAFDRLGWLSHLEGGAEAEAHRLDRRQPGGALGGRVRIEWGLGLPVHAAHWVDVPAAVVELLPAQRPPQPPPVDGGGGQNDPCGFWHAWRRADVDDAWLSLERAAAAWHGGVVRAGGVDWVRVAAGSRRVAAAAPGPPAISLPPPPPSVWRKPSCRPWRPPRRAPCARLARARAHVSAHGGTIDWRGASSSERLRVLAAGACRKRCPDRPPPKHSLLQT